LENHASTPPRDSGVHNILAALEEQLSALDGMGARIAAAHLDAAIQQLRMDQVRA